MKWKEEPRENCSPGRKEIEDRSEEEKHGVDAVSYGHTHVYERYRIYGIQYIEAASNGNNYLSPNDPPLFSQRLLPRI
jgi:hypothetical protein